jgi:hypothetical protein
MNIEAVETILIIVIVIFQISIFLRTKRQITIFKRVIPEASSVVVSKIFVPVREIENRSPGDILANASGYEAFPLLTENAEAGEISEITIIKSDEEENSVFGKILHSINTYLIKNRNAVTDFNLIKDIAERNADAVEEDINLTISIPLYLGLMGTMGGIVIGLFSMSSLTLAGTPGADNLGQGITVLLGGVKIAMIASFVGLLLTTLNSGLFYKGSKSRVEARKNDFYTFIQTELLPVVNQSLGSTFESLQQNLSRFNGEFSGNLNKLSGIFEANFDALAMQESILSKLENIDVATVAQYNIKVLKELQVSTKEFEKFNTHFSNINSYVDNSSTLIDRINDLLKRTDNLKEIASGLEDRLSQSKQLLDFLSAHFKNLEEYSQKTNETIESYDKKTTETIEEYRKATTQSIAETGFSIKETFNQIQGLIENSSKSVKDFTVEELDLLKKALSEIKTNLGNLQFLETINTDVSQFKDSAASQGERIRTLLQDVNENLEKTIVKLNSIERISLSLRRKGIKNYLKELFNSNGK